MFVVHVVDSRYRTRCVVFPILIFAMLLFKVTLILNNDPLDTVVTATQDTLPHGLKPRLQNTIGLPIDITIFLACPQREIGTGLQLTHNSDKMRRKPTPLRKKSSLGRFRVGIGEAALKPGGVRCVERVNQIRTGGVLQIGHVEIFKVQRFNAV